MRFKKINFLISGVIISVAFISILFPMDNRDKASREIQNLRVFAKLYGYIRFFHPSDEANQVNWDKFAIYGAEKVKNAKNSQELKANLEELFLPIAPTIQIYYSDVNPKKFDLNPPKYVEDLHFVTWQHYGVGLNSKNSIYKSVRLGRFEIPEGIQNEIWLELNNVKYKAKKFKLSAQVKADIKSEKSGAYIYIFAGDSLGNKFLEDYMRDRPIKQNEWKKYEITGEFSENPEYLEFGAELIGVGQMWVDDFHFYISDKEGDWEEVTLTNPSFDEVEPDNSPAIWKYHKGNMYEYTVVQDSENNAIQIKSVEDYTIPGMLFSQYPKVGEVINKELGGGLFCQVPLALWSDKNGTLGKDDKYSIEPLIAELNKIEIDSVTADNESVRLGNIVNAWNIFQHFYPYFEVVGTDWDAELTNILEEALSNQNEKDFYSTLRRLVAKLNDGHGGVYHKISREQAGFPFLVEWIENHVVITLLKDSTNFKVGDIVISIDGIPVEQILLNEEEYISGSPQWKRVKSLRRFGYGKEGTTAELQIMRNGQILEMEAVRNNKERLSEPGSPSIGEIENDIYYVNLDKAAMDEIREKMDNLANAKGVIFDLRGYPKGNHEVISHLLTEPDTSSDWMRVQQIIYPDQKNVVGFKKHGWHMQPKEPHIKGQVVFLTDGRAISYAESFMGFIEHYKLAEIVGQPTAGTNGNVNPFELPGGFRIVWTGMRVVKHDGSQHHLIGIQPTIPVHRTIQGLIEGRDEFMEKALEIIRSD